MLRAAAQRALERVRMRVGEARQREAPETPRARGRGRHPAGHRLDPAFLDLHHDAHLRAEPAQPRQLAPVGRHDPTRSTSLRARSTNASRWKRSNCSQVVSVAGSLTRSTNSDAVEVVELVLEGPGRQPAPDLIVLGSIAVEIAQPDVHVARHLAAQVRHRQATLVDLRDLLVERLDHRVHDHGQRHRRLVRIARVARAAPPRPRRARSPPPGLRPVRPRRPRASSRSCRRSAPAPTRIAAPRT